MKKVSVFLILCLALILIGYPNFREYLLINKGNKLSHTKEYLEADEVFKGAVSKYESIEGELNSVTNFYNGEAYIELLKTTKGQEFLRGNSESYIAGEELDPQKQIGFYEKALSEYKTAMKSSSDINIKKNYEIIFNRVKEIKEQQQNQDQNKKNQDQENEENKDKQDKEQNNKSQNENSEDQDKNQQNQQENGDQGKDNQDQSKNQSNKENDKDKVNQEESEKPEESKQEQGGSSEEKGRDTQKKEALATLKRLEDSEGQAFKNNERLQYLGGDNESEKDTW